MKIPANHKFLRYSGRIDWRKPQSPLWVYPATALYLRFVSRHVKLYVENHIGDWNSFLGYILDGEEGKWALPKEGEAELCLEAAGGEEHTLCIFKRQDACHHLRILGLELEEGGQLLEAPELPAKKIEVYGDSISVGEVSEAAAYLGQEDPPHKGEYTNSRYFYGGILAERLQAQLHNIAQSGIALLDHTGWFCAPEGPGMESVWDKTVYYPDFGESLDWDFSAYTPDVVIVALGQNDSHPADYMKEDEQGKRAALWKSAYRRFLEGLRGVYPEAYILCCTSLMYHDASWDRAIEEVVQEMQDARVIRHLFRRNGKGTPGHLRILEACEMAKELEDRIRSLDIEAWRTI